MNENDFEKVIERLRSGRLTNEAQVKQSVIVPILRGLGWDDTDPDECAPEYTPPPPATRRVDYALWQTPGRPLVFIEAQKLGGVDESGEDQLFQYAYAQGVPLLILTDGDVWNFYFSMESGVSADRCFYRAVLTKKESRVEYLQNFERYLGKTRVCSGEARVDAKKMLVIVRARKIAQKALPKAWQTLLKGPTPELRNMLAVAVENECGIKPAPGDVDDFLANRLKPLPPPPPPPPSPPPRPPRKKIIGYNLNGKKKFVGYGSRTLAGILKELSRDNPEFMFRFADATGGRTRRLVAQRRDDLYDDKDLIDQSIDLENGWWLGTNISSQVIRKNVKIACKIAGVKVTLIER